MIEEEIRYPLLKIEMEHDLSERFSYTHLMNPIVSAENICRLTSHINEIKDYVNENYDLVQSQKNDIFRMTSLLNSKLGRIEYLVFHKGDKKDCYTTKKDYKVLYEEISKSSKRLDCYMYINDRMVVLNEKKIKGLTSEVDEIMAYMEEVNSELVCMKRGLNEEKEKRKELEEYIYTERKIDYIWGFLLSCMIILLLLLK